MNTVYFMNQIMGNVFHTKENPAIPTAYYLGLSSTAPTINGDGVKEPSVNGTGYSRVKLSNLSAPNSGAIVNSGAINFAESITDWGVMTHYVVYDAMSDGNLLFYGPLSLSRSVEPNTSIVIKSGELYIQLSNIDA